MSTSSTGSTPLDFEDANHNNSAAPSSVSNITTTNTTKKKKKRSLGTFPCQHCDKVFSRSDHLARHNLNHEPKEVFVCDFPVEMGEASGSGSGNGNGNGSRGVGGGTTKCGKTFVRKDLKERHVRRHYELMNEASGTAATSPAKSDNNNGRTGGKRDIKRKKYGSSSSIATLATDTGISHQPGNGMQISNLIDTAERRVSYPNVHTPNGRERHSLLNSSHSNHFPPTHPTQLLLEQQHQQHQQHQNIHHHLQHQQTHDNNQLAHTPISGAPPIPPTIDSSPLYPLTTNLGYPNTNNFDTLLKNYGTTLPQNDILNWLFNDYQQTSVPYQVQPASTIPQHHQQQQQQQQKVPQIQAVPSFQQQHSQQSNTINFGLGQNIPNIPSPYVMSPQMTSNGQSNISQSVQPPYDSANILHNGIMDANVFSNESNPLDEFFTTNYNNMASRTARRSITEENARFPNQVYNTDTTTTSPTSTADSVAESAPALSDITLTEEGKYMHFSERYNIGKYRNYYLDTQLVNSIFQSLGINRLDIAKLGEANNKLENKLESKLESKLENRFAYYLSLYWSHFHPQFSIVHKPSFDTKTANPLLLASMIIVGAQYSFPGTAEQLSQQRKKSLEWEISNALAQPLRFALFQHEDFKSPVKVWILQCLNMLEWVEKNFLSRRLHERAHLHHGTTAQLLRRSAMMGGNPAKINKKSTSAPSSAGEESETNEAEDSRGEENNDENKDQVLFDQWVESESLKRATFMTFYLDIIDYVKFRHNPQILFYQLQLLNIPCNEETIWESTEINGSFKKLVKRLKKLQDAGNKKKVPKKESFLSAVKKLLKSGGGSGLGGMKFEELKAESPFYKKILLAGLISLMHQMQQVELQTHSSLLTGNHLSSNSKIWREMLSRVFDTWYFQIMDNVKPTATTGVSVYNTPKVNVSLPIFYLTQIIAMPDLTNYDIAIYCGSPANQSVAASMKDHHIVQRKMINLWGSKNKSVESLRSIVYCLVFLWNVFLGEENEPLEWNSNCDYHDSAAPLSLAILVLWSFCFVTCGLESNRYPEIEHMNETSLDNNRYEEQLATLSAENGYQYLIRIKEEFLTNLRKQNLHKEYSIHPYSGTKHHDVINKYCEILPLISNKQNISGLCFLIGSKLVRSQWEIMREHGKLIINCGLRSIGKKNILCLDLFDNEFQ